MRNPATWRRRCRSATCKGGVLHNAPCARLHTQALLREWGLRELTDVTELLVAELMTNAVVTTVKHQLDSPIRWRLSSNHAQVLIEVWDGDATPPPAATATPSPDAVGGRGLFLVDTLSTRWSGLGGGWRVNVPPPHRRPSLKLDDVYVDQVARKEQFLAEHPEVVITSHPEAPPHEYWQGHVPGYPEVTSAELMHLLDKLTDLLAVRDAHVRWPGWTFARTLAGWQGTETNGPELLMGRTLAEVEARVGQHERISGPS